MKTRRERNESVRAEAGKLSRREFARSATLAAAAMAAMPSTAGAVLAGAATSPATPGGVPAEGAAAAAFDHGARLQAVEQESKEQKPKLSAEAQAEVEAKIANILRRHGDRLSDAQKTDIRRLVREAQEPLETLRRYPLSNSDEPATILHLVRAEESTRRAPASRAAEKPAKRPGA